MGAVYRAHDRRLDRAVALKTCPDHPPDLAARFRREAQTLAGLDHPNLITVFDLGHDTDLGLLWMAQPLINGLSPADALRTSGPLPPARAAHIGQAVLDGLDCAHRAGLVHRDVKPGNIMLHRGADGAERVTLIDFGVARPIDDPDPLTASGLVMGTPAYMGRSRSGRASSHPRSTCTLSAPRSTPPSPATRRFGRRRPWRSPGSTSRPTCRRCPRACPAAWPTRSPPNLPAPPAAAVPEEPMPLERFDRALADCDCESADALDGDVALDTRRARALVRRCHLAQGSAVRKRTAGHRAAGTTESGEHATTLCWSSSPSRPSRCRSLSGTRARLSPRSSHPAQARGRPGRSPP